MELIKGMEAKNRQQQPTFQLQEAEEHVQKVFFHTLFQGNPWQTVMWVTGRDKGGATDSNGQE